MMDLGALSVLMSQGHVKQQAGISIFKQAMDTGEQQGEFLNQMIENTDTKELEKAAEPHKGANIDLSL